MTTNTILESPIKSFIRTLFLDRSRLLSLQTSTAFRVSGLKRMGIHNGKNNATDAFAFPYDGIDAQQPFDCKAVEGLTYKILYSTHTFILAETMGK